MRDRRDILYQTDVDAGGLQRARPRSPPRSGTSDKNLHGPQAVVHGLLRRAVGSLLSRERGSFARSLETHCAGAGPGNDIALVVGNRDDGVVKGRMNMHDAFGDVFSPAFSACRALARLGIGRSFGLRLFVSGIGHAVLLLTF